MDTNDIEDLRPYDLDPEDEAALLEQQMECALCWTTKDGSPMAVIMTYVYHDQKFWLSSSRQRKRVTAIQRDPRVCIVVSGAGCPIGDFKTVSYKGIATIYDDAETLQWFYRAQAEQAVGEFGPERVAEYIAMLDSPNRVVIGIETGTRVSFDGAKRFIESSDPRASRYAKKGAESESRHQLAPRFANSKSELQDPKPTAIT
jgi:general stress protein 26